MPNAMSDIIRVRFAPSPTGYLHVGGARTVLYNWLLARKAGGVFVLRIEDTDRSRLVEDSVGKILDDLCWLGLDWDEGPEVGGSFGPYFQSRRLDLYREYTDKLLESGDAYHALETPAELAVMRERMKGEPGGFKYPRPHPLPTVAQAQAAREAGKPVVVRFMMPGTDIKVIDDVLGEVVLPAEELEDFVIQKSDGWPTYHFACVVDDELMKITHVLRGQEHLMNTPKHIAMQRALGFNTPRYLHLPVIFNMSGSKMSKRDKEKAIKKGAPPPEIDVYDFRAAGYLPEALLNFLALLGWNPGDDREHFPLVELTEAFSVDRIGKTNARFDRDKLLSFNTDWCAKASPARLLEAFNDYLVVNAGSDTRAAGGRPGSLSEGGGLQSPISNLQSAIRNPQSAILHGSIPPAHLLQICAGFRTFAQVVDKVGFLYIPDEAVEYDPKAVKKVLNKNDGAAYAMLEGLLPRLESLPDWTVEALQTLIETFCAEREAKLGNVAQPLRVAITGTTISPPIYDSLALLGKHSTCARVRRCHSTLR